MTETLEKEDLAHPESLDLVPAKGKGDLIRKFAEKIHLSEKGMLSVLKNTCFRQTGETEITDAQMLQLLIVCHQYGLDPFTKQIYAFPDKKAGIVPIVSVDGWSSLMNNHEQFDGMEFEYSSDIEEPAAGKKCPAWCDVIIYRKDRAHATRVREHLDECYRPPFKVTKGDRTFTVPGPWQSHTKRMLRHKTMIQGGRVAFGLTGIYDEDEGQRIIEGEAQVVESKPLEAEPEPTSRTDSVKAKLKDKVKAAEANETPGEQMGLPPDYGEEPVPDVTEH